MNNSLLVIALVLILIGVAMVVTGFDAPIPRISVSAGELIIVVGVFCIIAWLIFLLIGAIPK